MIKTRHLLSNLRIGIVCAGNSWGQSLRGAEIAPEKISPILQKQITNANFNTQKSIIITEYKDAHEEIKRIPKLKPYEQEIQDYTTIRHSLKLQKSADSSKSQNSSNLPKPPNSKVNLNLPLTNGKASELIARDVELSCKNNDLTIVIGGDHSIAVGSCEGHFRNYKNNAKFENHEPLLVFIDAHADLNTDKTSPSGNIHGMPVRMLLQEFRNEANIGFEWMESVLNYNNIFYFGLRCVDDGEEKVLQKFDIKRSYAKDFNVIPSEQKEACVGKFLDDLRGDKQGILLIHLSFCIDALEPMLAPATGTIEPNGLVLEDVFMIIQKLWEKEFRVVCFDLVEINPVIKNYPEDRKVTEADVEKTVDSGNRVALEVVRHGIR